MDRELNKLEYQLKISICKMRNSARLLFIDWLNLGEILSSLYKDLEEKLNDKSEEEVDNIFDEYVKEQCKFSVEEAHACIRLYEIIPKGFELTNAQCDYINAHDVMDFVDAYEAFMK